MTNNIPAAPYPEYRNDIHRAREQAGYAKKHGQTAQLAALIRLIKYLLTQVEVKP